MSYQTKRHNDTKIWQEAGSDRGKGNANDNQCSPNKTINDCSIDMWHKAVQHHVCPYIQVDLTGKEAVHKQACNHEDTPCIMGLHGHGCV